jgi:3-hydroxyacyl-[acyl-carrier-protein] dehydratase
MTYETRLTVAAEHPSLPGHFPGAPIVPAVVILDEVAAALGHWRSDVQITGIPIVKFVAALKPDQSFSIVLSTRQVENEVDFSCRVETRTVVQGRLQIRARSS